MHPIAPVYMSPKSTHKLASSSGFPSGSQTGKPVDEATHKLMGFYVEVLILLFTWFSASLSGFLEGV